MNKASAERNGGTWHSVELLRNSVVAGTAGAPEAGDPEGPLAAVRESLLDGLAAGDGGFLRQGHRGLHTLYAVLLAEAMEAGGNPEVDRAFLLGRVAEQLEVAAAAVRRSRPRQFEGELLNVNNRPILEVLFHDNADLNSTTIAARSAAYGPELDKATISRALDRLERAGVIATHRIGRSRFSRLTPAGREAIGRALATKRPTRPSAEEVLGELRSAVLEVV